MTSYERQGENVYNGVEAPVYNAFSYTWGYYQVPEGPSLVIHGIDWPIPAIRCSHFTRESFKNALSLAAKGFETQCDWLWLDIACIPQMHQHETPEATAIRFQEIGRQAEIFARAQDVFAWLSSPDRQSLPNDIIGDSRVIRRMAPTGQGPPSRQQATDFMHWLDEHSKQLHNWIVAVLGHPFFHSLWTLQEMVLRSDGFILLGDQTVYQNAGNRSKATRFASLNDRLRSLHEMVGTYNTYYLSKLQRAEEVAFNQEESQASRPNIVEITERFQTVIQLLEEKGFGMNAQWFPHRVYSSAKRRRATQLRDRILGIMQVYEISCNPGPPGASEEEQLQHLEDEFGQQLVARYPLFSQIFVHGSEMNRPRRTWLITQGCDVDDSFWWRFSPASTVGNSFESLTTLSSVDAPGVDLYFKGLCWNLDEFVQASSPLSPIPQLQKDQLFCREGSQGSISYLGLVLDYHAAYSALGRRVSRFSSYEAMHDAVRRLYQSYCWIGNGNCFAAPIKVALLGWSTMNAEKTFESGPFFLRGISSGSQSPGDPFSNKRSSITRKPA
ncbi:uncharacterized protein PG998_010607 [Apiospora kogelbergensis]|uniref:uncharacterized protein n=1 Tax=Apiospora kogelbergensis TaxID=1337665 RepID=UPI00312CCD52